MRLTCTLGNNRAAPLENTGMPRSKEELAQGLAIRRKRPLELREDASYVVLDVVEWVETLNSEEKDLVREAMGDLASTEPNDILWKELSIIRETGAHSAATPLERLARSIGNSRWRDDILITLQELGCGTARDLYLQRMNELRDSGPRLDHEASMGIEQFLVRMIFLDADEAIRLQAPKLAETAGKLKNNRGSMALYLRCYLSAAPGRLVDLLAGVATIDPQAALLVRDALVADLGSSSDYLEKKHGPQVRSLCASIKNWSAYEAFPGPHRTIYRSRATH